MFCVLFRPVDIRVCAYFALAVAVAAPAHPATISVEPAVAPAELGASETAGSEDIGSFPAVAFDLQGHRGARGLMPENSLPAFAKALSIGVTTLELDTGITKDGVVVVTHNQTLEPAITRDSDGIWLKGKQPAIITLTLEEIRRFDVGRIDGASPMASRLPDQVAVDGAKIPTLEEVFGLVNRSGNQVVRLNIETKINPLKPEMSVDPETFVAAIVKLIKAHGFERRATIQSFDWRTLQIAQRIAPEIDTVYLTIRRDWHIGSRGPSPWTAGFDISAYRNSAPAMIEAAGGRIWAPFHEDLNESKVQEAHALKLKVIPWTINDKADMKRLIAMGVDGIITDYPDRLREIMAEKGMPLPSAAPVQ